MKILVTGSAGFIGFHLAQRLLAEGNEVLGIDNFNDYYDVRLKEARNAILERNSAYQLHRVNIADQQALDCVFNEFKPEIVVNLAAAVGVRHSLSHPEEYIESNVVGFLNVLECCRHSPAKPKLLYASSSSVYGGNRELPFSEDQRVDSPVSLYAASKKTDELMAHCYSHLYGLQTIGFRFFSVYGPWGRPDVAAWIFAKAMMEGRPIQVFNHGDMYRDFTYIDDIIDGVVRCVRKLDTLPQCAVYNIGNHCSEKLMDMISVIAREIGVENPKLEMLPMQAGDVPKSFASVDKLNKAVGYEPTTPISVGMPKFIAWYKDWKAGKYAR